MARRWRKIGPLLLAVVAVVPASVQAQGVRVDPDSPTGTEYQLPLERARQDAQQGGPPSKVRPGERTAPAFGEGIATVSKGRSQATSGAASRAGTGGDETVSTPQGASAGSADPPATAPSKAADSPGSLLLAVAAIAAGVLVLGAAIGLLLRHRSGAGPG